MIIELKESFEKFRANETLVTTERYPFVTNPDSVFARRLYERGRFTAIPRAKNLYWVLHWWNPIPYSEGLREPFLLEEKP